jgi:preprotein translocase subunit SecB
MKAVLSHIQLITYGVGHLSVAHNEEYVPNAETPVEPLPHVYIFPQTDEDGSLRVVVEVVVSSTEPDDHNAPLEAIPYDVSTQVVGLFRLDDGLPEKTADSLTAYSAPAILYSIARLQIMQATQNGRWGPYMLPLVDLSAMFKQKAAEGDASDVPGLPVES